MKKTIICGLACLSLAAAPSFGVFAESLQGDPSTGYFTGSHDATVGEVDETIYSVDLSWGDMTFDWKYARDLNKYGFEPSRECVSTYYHSGDGFSSLEFEAGAIYSDANCTTVVTEEPADDTLVYDLSTFKNHISVQDRSTNGKVKVLASFTPVEKYNWVTGEFMSGGAYTDSESITHLNVPRENYLRIAGDLYYYFDEVYSDGVIPATENTIVDGEGFHFARLMLRTKDGTDLSGVDVSADDKIGTIIIAIEPDME